MVLNYRSMNLAFRVLSCLGVHRWLCYLFSNEKNVFNFVILSMNLKCNVNNQPSNESQLVLELSSSGIGKRLVGIGRSLKKSSGFSTDILLRLCEMSSSIKKYVTT